MAKIRRGKRKPSNHEGEIEDLIAFMGYDLLEHIERIANVEGQKETLEIVGPLLSGYFTLRVTFNGAERH